MTHHVPRWVEPYIGVPFDPEVKHCWWLVRKILWERAQIEVPAYSEDNASDLIKVARIIRRDAQEGYWTKVEKPQPLDVVMMSGSVEGGRAMIHAGIMVTDKMLVHNEIGIDSMAISINDHRVRFRIKGYYRHKELMHHAA